MYQIRRILGIPYSFAKSLSEKMADIWNELSARMISQSHRRATFKVEGNSSKVIGLFPFRDDFISLRRFLSITENLHQEISNAAGVENVVVDVDDESSSAFFYTAKEFAPIRTEKADIFRYGIGFSASSLELYSPSISESLFRLICSNMTYAPSHFGVMFRNRDEGRITHAVRFMISEPERITQYPEILNSLTVKKLSYREVETAYTYLSKLKDLSEERLVPDIDRRIPLSRVAKAYGYESLQAAPNSPSWKSSAKTPITVYEVFNHRTEIGSHYTHIPEKQRLEVLICAGELMFKERWDLEELAPQEVDFADWRNEVVQSAQ